MNEYKVDHSGSCRAKVNEPVYLPDDVAAALGDSAKPTGRTKDAKNILNKMVGANDAKTK